MEVVPPDKEIPTPIVTPLPASKITPSRTTSTPTDATLLVSGTGVRLDVPLFAGFRTARIPIVPSLEDLPTKVRSPHVVHTLIPRNEIHTTSIIFKFLAIRSAPIVSSVLSTDAKVMVTDAAILGRSETATP